MQLYRRLIWIVHFVISYNNICECDVSCKVLKNAFLSLGKLWSLSLQVLESFGKHCSNDYTNLVIDLL